MPELIEVEQYRQALDRLRGLVVEAVEVADTRFVRPPRTSSEKLHQLKGHTFTHTDRVGKLLLAHFVDKTRTCALGLRFGMTGRLVIDGWSPIEALEYASRKDDPRWDRVTLVIGGRGVSIRDQRRLGSVELDPDLEALGFEASTLTVRQLAEVCSGRRKAIKGVLLDQGLVAGLGNLLVDETLWQAGMSPSTPAGSLGPRELHLLASEVVRTVGRLSARGGSHTGDSFKIRNEGAVCERCGGAMAHGTVAGRSTWWCVDHQG